MNFVPRRAFCGSFPKKHADRLATVAKTANWTSPIFFSASEIVALDLRFPERKSGVAPISDLLLRSWYNLDEFEDHQKMHELVERRWPRVVFGPTIIGKPGEALMAFAQKNNIHSHNWCVPGQIKKDLAVAVLPDAIVYRKFAGKLVSVEHTTAKNLLTAAASFCWYTPRALPADGNTTNFVFHSSRQRLRLMVNAFLEGYVHERWGTRKGFATIGASIDPRKSGVVVASRRNGTVELFNAEVTKYKTRHNDDEDHNDDG